MANDSDVDAKVTKLQNNAALLDPEPDKNDRYKPNKRRRAIRRQVYERFYDLRDDPNRQEAEQQWELADKEFGMYFDPPDPDGWQADLHLPDAFAAIQTQEQERIERKSRPMLDATEESDEPLAELANAVMTYNMDTTGFDYQYYLGKLSAASRGTAFYWDRWRTDKRTVKDPVSLNKDGTIKYQSKEIIDFDDDYMEWLPNEFCYVDEKADHIDKANDWIRREVLNIQDFYRVYGSKPGFFDTEFVKAGGDTSNRSFFRLPKDITEQDVEILHYENRAVDAYWVVANNITICDEPLQTKHKELSISVGYQYKIPGRFYGVGIPKVIHYLSEERRSLRNLNMDRQKIIIGGAFLHNNAFDLDDEDEVLYPGKIISVDTNGQAIGNALQQVNMGDVSGSYFKSEEILLEDIRRADGIDDRIAVNTGSTATQAAIVKESTLKRINLISITNEMDTLIRIGKLKWSNLQWMSPIPRIERIVEEGQEREKPEYRKIVVKGKKFEIQNDGGKSSLKMDDVRGKSAFLLDKKMAKFLQGSFDITMDSEAFTQISKAIEQTKKSEAFSLMLSNPATLAVMDINGSSADYLKVNNINPDVWLKNPNGGKRDMMMLAEAENEVMFAGQPLSGTDGATEDHTMIHLLRAKYLDKDPEFLAMTPEMQGVVRQNFQAHIFEEHDNNPATGKIADLMGTYGLGKEQLAASQGIVPGMTSPFGVGAGQTTQPQAQVADLQPTNFANPE